MCGRARFGFRCTIIRLGVCQWGDRRRPGRKHAYALFTHCDDSECAGAAANWRSPVVRCTPCQGSFSAAARPLSRARIVPKDLRQPESLEHTVNKKEKHTAAPRGAQRLTPPTYQASCYYTSRHVVVLTPGRPLPNGRARHALFFISFSITQSARAMDSPMEILSPDWKKLWIGLPGQLNNIREIPAWRLKKWIGGIDPWERNCAGAARLSAKQKRAERHTLAQMSSLGVLRRRCERVCFKSGSKPYQPDAQAIERERV